MKPSQVASTLRRIASALEASKKPDRTLVSRDLKRVLAAMGNRSSANWGVSQSPAGPWTTGTLSAIVQAADKMKYNQSYSDKANGVVLFARTPLGVIFAVTDQSAVHGEDAMDIWEVSEVDEAGGWDHRFVEAGDDLADLLGAFADESPESD